MKHLTNYHSHCSYCDGRADMEAFVLEAIRQKFHSYGISSHAPLPFETQWTMKEDLLPTYIEEVRKLKKKYQHQIELYCGLEIDYLSKEWNPASDLFQGLDLDYRIGSVHMVETPEGKLVDSDGPFLHFREILEQDFDHDVQKMVTEYFSRVTEMILKGGFDIVGHVDKIALHASICDKGLYTYPWFEEMEEEVFGLIAQKGIMVEINTKAFETMNTFYPHSCHFKRMSELKIPVVVNSDAHFPQKINASRDIALQTLKGAGYKEVFQLINGGWKGVGI